MVLGNVHIYKTKSSSYNIDIKIKTIRISIRLGLVFGWDKETKEVSKNQSTYFIPFYECSLTGSFPARSSTQNIDSSSMRNRCCFPVEFLSL